MIICNIGKQAPGGCLKVFDGPVHVARVLQYRNVYLTTAITTLRIQLRTVPFGRTKGVE